MSILAECPACGRLQRLSAKACINCSNDMDRSKKSRTVRYWINFRLPGGKQRREPVSYSIKEARDADGKRRAQKREHRIFDMLPESNMTFEELADWYLELESVKKLASYERISISLKNFNKFYGNRINSTILPLDLENYQATRSKLNISYVTIDLEISTVKTMVNKAFDNDIVDGRALRAFRKTKKVSKMSERVRDRIISINEYLKLIDAAVEHTRDMMVVAFNTGMRPGEIKNLRWKYINLKEDFIRLPAKATKERATKNIPINRHAKESFESLNKIRHIDHDYVFTYDGKPFSNIVTGPSNAFQTACKKAGIPSGKKKENGIIPHDFRRTFKTNCLKAGIDKVYRDTIVGHSLRGMDAHYIKPSDEDLRKSMDRFTAWLDDQIKQSVDHGVDEKKISN